MRKRLLLSIVLLVVMLVVMRVQGADLARQVRGGILALEFAGRESVFRDRLLRMGRAGAVLNTWLDFGFIAAYTFFFVTACRALASRFRNGKIPLLFVRLAMLGGLLDIVENTGMLASMYGVRAMHRLRWLSAVPRQNLRSWLPFCFSYCMLGSPAGRTQLRRYENRAYL